MKAALRFPWSRSRRAGHRLAIRSSPSAVAWLEADAHGRPLRAGIEPITAGETPAEWGRRMRAQALPTGGVTALLALPEAQLLQIEAPAVRPDELKNAARWRIKDMVDARPDELAIDVMPVGDDKARGHQAQLFVVAARHTLIEELTRRTHKAGFAISVIDIAELSQRNLLNRAAFVAGLSERATALLMRHGQQALLTVAAGGELFYARHLDWDEQGLVPAPAAPAPADEFEGLDFVDYGAGDGSSDDIGAPRLVVEVQRSIDVWERTWPSRPLAHLWVDAGERGSALVALLEAALGCPVSAFDAETLFPGFDALAPTPALRDAVLPLVGALQRPAA